MALAKLKKEPIKEVLVFKDAEDQERGLISVEIAIKIDNLQE